MRTNEKRRRKKKRPLRREKDLRTFLQRFFFRPTNVCRCKHPQKKELGHLHNKEKKAQLSKNFKWILLKPSKTQ